MSGPDGGFEPLAEYETELSRAQKRALNVLGARTMSRGAMEKRLRELGEDEETAADTADWLARIGLIDDAQYAREIVASCVRSGYGARRIREELYKRYIPRELWDAALGELEDGETVAAAEAFIAKKLRGETPDFDDRRKIGAALARRGHGWGDINAAFERYIEGLNDTEGDAGDW
ncbi:MAG: recombination regulator RecX [Oscillospiraceae bacterium]|jgi:regulatory protein|nr:recombination regulator RecX [Oscillospiraceae bacterium]